MLEKTVDKRRKRSCPLYLLLRNCKTWITSEEAPFYLSSTSAKTKLTSIRAKNFILTIVDHGDDLSQVLIDGDEPSSCKPSRVVGGRAPDHPRYSPSKLGWKRANSYCHLMVLKAMTNDRHHLALCHDEFCGSRSGLCRSGGINNNNN
ncbi:hypothetical protein TNCV_4870381 [Trichonephila clavipes]|nr:hypothetical protein TNCV_4870381 [Trichonephila clavipes]